MLQSRRISPHLTTDKTDTTLLIVYLQIKISIYLLIRHKVFKFQKCQKSSGEASSIYPILNSAHFDTFLQILFFSFIRHLSITYTWVANVLWLKCERQVIAYMYVDDMATSRIISWHKLKKPQKTHLHWNPKSWSLVEYSAWKMFFSWSTGYCKDTANFLFSLAKHCFEVNAFFLQHMPLLLFAPRYKIQVFSRTSCIDNVQDGGKKGQCFLSCMDRRIS